MPIFIFYCLSISILLFQHLDFLFLNINPNWNKFLYDGILLLMLPFVRIKSLSSIHKKDIIFFLLFLSFTYISFLYSGNTIWTYIFWLRQVFKYLILFLVILSINNTDFNKVKKFFNYWIYIFFLIQILIAFYQIHILKFEDPDLQAGTIGSLNFLLIGFIFIIKFLQNYIDKKISLITFTFVFFTILYLYIQNDTKSGVFLIFPIVIFFYYSYLKNSLSANKFVVFFIFFLISIYGVLSLPEILPKELSNKLFYYNFEWFITGQEQGINLTDKSPHVGRIAAYKLSFETINKNILTLLFGLGNTSMFDSAYIPGGFSRKFGYTYYQIIPTALVNMGFLGAIFWLVFYIRIFYTIENKYLVTKAVVLLFILSGFLNNTWLIDFYNYFLWGMFAVYLREKSINKRTSKNSIVHAVLLRTN